MGVLEQPEGMGVAASPPLCPASPAASGESAPSGAAANARLDHRDPSPQIEASGRIYRVTVDVYVPHGVQASADQLEEWLSFELLNCGSISMSNPLHKFEVEGRRVVDIRDMKCREFTEWEPERADGSRSGTTRLVRDGETYNPVWVEPASAIEAASAGETAKAGSTEGESAVPKGDAQ